MCLLMTYQRRKEKRTDAQILEPEESTRGEKRPSENEHFFCHGWVTQRGGGKVCAACAWTVVQLDFDGENWS